MKTAVRTSIKKAIQYLSKRQLQNGLFRTRSSTHPNDFSKSIPVKTTYITSNILHCLTCIPTNPLIKEMIRRSQRLLQSQFHPTLGSLNYWLRDSEEIKSAPIPDDLDDSVVAFAALEESGIEAGDSVFPLLTHLEIKPGGPYKTWIVSDDQSDRWGDVDIGVNANILWFAAVREIYLPNILETYEASLNSSLKSIYTSDYVILAFISRAIADGDIQHLASKNSSDDDLSDVDLDQIINKTIKYIEKKQSGPEWQNSLAKTFTALSLINFDRYDHPLIQKTISLLSRTQNAQGSWPANMIGLGHSRLLSGKTAYDGSEELTTAFVMETFSKYLAGTSQHIRIKKSQIISPDLIPEYKMLSEEFVKWAKKQKHLNQAKLLSLARKLTDQIFTQEAFACLHKVLGMLPKSHRAKITDPFTRDLLLNNLKGWMYFYLHDISIDEGIQDRELIEIMDHSKEQFLEFFSRHYKVFPRLKKFISDKMALYKRSIQWEQENCKITSPMPKTLPDYRNYTVFTWRNYSYVFGFVLILLQAGYKMNSPHIKSIVEFLKYFLIARQLNDDAHDWEEDLQRGKLNSTSVYLIDNHEIRDLEALRERFWTETVDKIVEKILHNLSLAEKALASLPKKSRINLYTITERLKKIARKTIRERDIVLSMISDN